MFKDNGNDWNAIVSIFYYFLTIRRLSRRGSFVDHLGAIGASARASARAK